MTEADRTFQLRYVGVRFMGGRLPLDVLSDLPAFRDLLVFYSKENWRAANSDRRLPKGFEASIAFDLVGIDSGSAIPRLSWKRDVVQAMLPGFADQLEVFVERSCVQLVELVDGAGHDRLPTILSSEQIRALNKLGSGLRDHERIEFVGSKGRDGNVVYLDSFRRKILITHVSETYQARSEGIGKLLGLHIDGYINVLTTKHGEIRIPIDSDRVASEFDGNIDADVQYSLQVKLDKADCLREIVEVLDVALIDPASANGLGRCRQRIVELQHLKGGWNDGDGLEIGAHATQAADLLLSKRPHFAGLYKIYPTIAGGVLFEFEHLGWDLSVEISAMGSVEIYGIRIDGPEEMDVKAFDELDDMFFAAFDDLFVGAPA
ncbi:hypothetical protein [Beijerinckia sp. L45]|uniref:hypothetical protein n=1 Tax=Beijerinckia sp. L45 TaxID=1641855 RepID=UPI00131CFC6A|nr:hypothetical protein [Beijerinckia sp. L45]